MPFLFSAAAPWQDQVKLREEQLEQVEEQIAQLENQLKTLSNQHKSTIQTIETLKTEERLNLAEHNRLKLQIEEIEENISALETDIAERQETIKTMSDRVTLVLRKLYKRGSLDYLRLLLTVDSMEEISIAQAYLSRLAREEISIINGFNQMVRKYRDSVDELQEKKADLTEKQNAAAEALARAREKRTSHEQFLQDIRHKTGVYNQALEEKQQAREELKQLIRQLAARESQVQTAVSFASLKGQMNWPVRGTLITRFGAIRDRVYDVTIENDGIEIKAAAGTAVISVAAGKVLYGEWNDMGGNMVVIDHGNRYYTVYAHLSRIIADKGQTVAQGDIIGEVGDSASLKGSLLRFEIRHVTKNSEPVALDPLEWLKKR